jgi:hypothetical protein
MSEHNEAHLLATPEEALPWWDLPPSLCFWAGDRSVQTTSMRLDLCHVIRSTAFLSAYPLGSPAPFLLPCFGYSHVVDESGSNKTGPNQLALTCFFGARWHCL